MPGRTPEHSMTAAFRIVETYRRFPRYLPCSGRYNLVYYSKEDMQGLISYAERKGLKAHARKLRQEAENMPHERMVWPFP